MIFQEPMTALDPVFTVGKQIRETILRHEAVSRAEADRRALELLDLVQVPSAKRRLGRLPARAVRRAAAAHDDRHRAVLPPAIAVGR